MLSEEDAGARAIDGVSRPITHSGTVRAVSGLPVLAIRADGGPGFGAGHLARGLALVQAWTDRHGSAVLVTQQAPSFWAERFVAEGCALAQPGAVDREVDWWAIDGYHLGGTECGLAGPRVLVIDDHGAAGRSGMGADLVVDQNLGADPANYGGARAVLTGPRYALLRREVQGARRTDEVPVVVGQVLVVLGGSPSPEVRGLGDAVAASRRLSHLDVRVLAGTDDIASALATADLALAAAGTVSWELCHHGVPSVLVSVAANQEPVAEELARVGAAVRVTPTPEAAIEALCALAADPAMRTQMARIGRSLVDGMGARRVACRLRSELLVLREATQMDASSVYKWNNDPLTRAGSFSSEPYGWDSHVSWFLGRLARVSSWMYIASDAIGGDVGLVRFDQRKPGVVEIGVTVAPARRGEGWGGALVDAGCRHWASQHGSVRVDAQIKAGNEASVRAFLDADFDEASSVDTKVLRYARHLDDDQ